MNSASNMMAKWYQSAISPWPKAPLRICAIPTASDGAPPERPSRVCSPTSLASPVICSGDTVKPQVRMTAAAASGVPPRVVSGTLIAKYTPGSSSAAAQSAMTATNDSMSMPP